MRLTILIMLISVTGFTKEPDCYWAVVNHADKKYSTKDNWHQGPKKELMKYIESFGGYGNILFIECPPDKPSLNWAKRGYWWNGEK